LEDIDTDDLSLPSFEEPTESEREASIASAVATLKADT
jgi:hypothetical protein